MDNKNLNIPGLVAAGVAAVGVFLPWVSLGPFSANGLSDWGGIVALLAAVAAGVLTFMQMKWAPIAGAAAAGVTLLFVIRAMSLGGMSLLGFGVWVTLAGSIGIVATTFSLWKQG